MKISSEKLIEKIKQEELKLNVLLLFGNDWGTIIGLTKTIYNYVKKKNNIGEIVYFDCKNDKNISIKGLINTQSLLYKAKFIVIKNISEKICEELKDIQFNEDVVVINGEGIKPNSNIKKYFDAHKAFISVPCYELKKREKVKIIDMFLHNNNIVLTKDVYWYLVDNISNDYLILGEELEKICIYGSSSLSVENLKMLLIPKINTDLDDLFFKCATKNNGVLLKNTNSFIRSQSDSYEIIGNIKRFVQILTLALTNKKTRNFDILTDIYLPKYLFMKKEAFANILKKISFEKIFFKKSTKNRFST